MGYICSDCSLSVNESRDFKAIRDLILHDDISSGLLSPQTNKEIVFYESEERLDNEYIIYYLMKVNDEIAGFCLILNLFNHDEHDEKCFLVDIGILKKFRGKQAYQLAKIALNKFLDEEKPNRLLGLIKIKNKKALYFAMKVGFEIIKKDDVHYFLEVKNGQFS